MAYNLNTEKTDLRWRLSRVTDETHITSVVLNSDDVGLLDRWMAEIVGGTEVEEMGRRTPYTASQQQETFKNLNQFAENSNSHKRNTSGSVSWNTNFLYD